MNVLKIEAFSGLSGDMFLGALVGLTQSHEALKQLPQILRLSDVTVQIREVIKKGLSCTKVEILDNSVPTHRHYSDIRDLIERTDLPQEVKALSKKILLHLGMAESHIHNVPIEEVHFHEVGAIDSILDIVGSAFMLSRLSFQKTLCSPVATGRGFVDCEHGRMPVPAPATEVLLRGFLVEEGPVASELTTPTGAAILKALEPDFAQVPLKIVKSHYGAGDKEFAHPNCLRLSLGETAELQAAIYTLVCQIDDLPGEQLGEDFHRQLLNLGALDMTITPVLMKKGRPGQKLEILCDHSKLQILQTFLLEHTSTLGTRSYPVQRRTLDPYFITEQTPFGSVRFKCVTLPSGKTRATPEYDDCQKLAQSSGASSWEVYRAALATAERVNHLSVPKGAGGSKSGQV